MKTLRIGMIGTGRITQRFVYDYKEVPYVALTAIYNPHEGSAGHFVETYHLEDTQAFDSLSAFWPKVDAVYIAAPHETHYDYAKQALSAGKHVLCEKPMCLEGEEAVELYQLAREKHLILLEAIKTAYCPGFQGILKLIESGKIGVVHDVEACFTRLGNASLREVWDTKSGGSFTEFGTYSLLPIVKLLGTESREACYWSLPARTGVDSYTKATISYEHAIATAKTGIGVKSEGQLVIAGSNGYILVPSPWWLTQHVEVHYEDPNRVEVYDFPFEGSGLRYEITSFAKRVLALEEMLGRFGDDAEKMELIWNYLLQIDGVTPEESIWLACQMESFRKQYKKMQKKNPKMGTKEPDRSGVRIWAHRGCCMRYPENTLVAFEAAAKLERITGIELDVQLTRDGEMVVIHDETLDRTTTGSGAVRDYTLTQIKKMSITGSGCGEPYRTEEGTAIMVPTLREVFDLLEPYCKGKGLLINIELKNSVVRYEGMEQKVLDLVAEYELKPYIVYSSFLPESMGLIKSLDANTSTGILAGSIYDCMKGAADNDSDALHPCILGLDINGDFRRQKRWKEVPIRAWNADEPFYGQERRLSDVDLRRYEAFGVTDIITNVPEKYLWGEGKAGSESCSGEG